MGRKNPFIQRSSAFRILTGVVPVLLITVIPAIVVSQDRAPGWEAELTIPAFAYGDRWSEFTAGAGWDISYNQPFGRLGGNSRWEFAGHLQTKGAWFINSSLNSNPLLAEGNFYLERNLGSPKDDVIQDNGLVLGDDDDYRSFDGRMIIRSYRIGIGVESGYETDQEHNNRYFRAGPAIMLLNREDDTMISLLPSLIITREWLAGSRKTDDSDRANDDHNRWRIMLWNQLDLGGLGLSEFVLAGAFQYTYDYPAGSESLDRTRGRAGYAADLSRRFRFDHRETPRRIDLFARFTAGRIAPFLESTQTIKAGIRLPYQN